MLGSRVPMLGAEWRYPDFWAAAVVESFILWLIFREAYRRSARRTALKGEKGSQNVSPKPPIKYEWPSNPVDILFGSNTSGLPTLLLRKTRGLRCAAKVVTLLAMAATVAPLGIAAAFSRPGIAGMIAGAMFFLAIVSGCTAWMLASLVRTKIRIEIAKASVSGGLICLVCGYDLRGLPEPLTCPECGAGYQLAAVRNEWGRVADVYGPPSKPDGQ